MSILRSTLCVLRAKYGFVAHQSPVLRYHAWFVTQDELELVKSNLNERRGIIALGRRGGKSRSEAKAKAARENGKKGGRPRKKD